MELVGQCGIATAAAAVAADVTALAAHAASITLHLTRVLNGHGRQALN